MRPELSTQWPQISNLPPLLPKAACLTPDMVPGPFQAWLVDVSERMQVPFELVAAPAIVDQSSVVGRKVCIRPKRQDDWEVIANLWGIVVASPGQLKSPAIAEANRPMDRLIANAVEEYERDWVIMQANLQVHEAQIDAVNRDLKAAAKKQDWAQLASLRDQLAKLLQERIDLEVGERRYRTNDPTVEKLAELLKDNPRGIQVKRDEIVGFLRNLEKPGHEGDRAFYLESWAGNGRFSVDRIARGTIHVEALCVSVFGSIQPGRLHSYVNDAVEGGAADDGLLQRFQIAVFPETHKKWRNVDRKPDLQARDRVSRIFKILDDFDPVGVNGLTPEEDVPHIHFSEDAQKLFDEWRSGLEARLRSGEIETPAFESHLAKYRSLMPSLALLFHLVDWADTQSDGEPLTAISPVGSEAADLAIRWCRFLEEHAKKIYAVVIRPDLQAAHALAKKIQQGKIKDGESVRDIHRHHWTFLNKSSTVYDGLDILREHGWIRLGSTETQGRPTDLVRLNPSIKVRKQS